jgi:hypothetical protein
MSQLIALLKKIRKRPGMYIGFPSVIRLSAFLHGYNYALLELTDAPGDPFLIAFQEWITQRLAPKHHLPWEEVILKESGSEAAALNRFWELLDEYLAEQGEGASAVASEQDSNGAGSSFGPEEKERQP